MAITYLEVVQWIDRELIRNKEMVELKQILIETAGAIIEVDCGQQPRMSPELYALARSTNEEILEDSLIDVETDLRNLLKKNAQCEE